MELELNKNFLIQKSQEYTESSSIVSKVDIYKKNPSKFIKNLHKIPLYYIKEILDAHPEYALHSHLQSHFLHFAAKSNDPDLIGFAINKSIKAGIQHYPNIDMKYRNEICTFDIFNYCILNDLDNAYATFLSRLSQPEKSSYKEHYLLSFENNSKCLKFLNTIIDEPHKQSWIYSFLHEKVKNQDDYYLEYISGKYEYNMNQFANIGVDLHYTENNQMNYFEIFCEMFSSNFTSDVMNKKDVFAQKILNMYHYFLDNGFILDSAPNPITKKALRDTFENQIQFLKLHFFEKPIDFNAEIIILNKKSLENELKISTNLKNEVIGVEMSLLETLPSSIKKLKI